MKDKHKLCGHTRKYNKAKYSRAEDSDSDGGYLCYPTQVCLYR